MEQLFARPRAQMRMHDGPLGGYIDAYIDLLATKGYGRDSRRRSAWLVGDFSRWLNQRGTAAAAVSQDVVDAFLRGRKRRRAPRVEDRSTLLRLLAHLALQGVICMPSPERAPTAAEQIEAEYVDYMLHERNLAPATIRSNRIEARNLLTSLFADGPLTFDTVAARDVMAHIRRATKACRPNSACRVVGGVRAFLRFALYRGWLGTDMSSHMPAPAVWSQSSIPRSLRDEQVVRTLAQCDRTTPSGCRDYAVILLLARLGLRAGEVVALRLEDIDWEAGELQVRNGQTRVDRLPLPYDVGQAMAQYLSEARPSCSCRQVFLRAQAPIEGFSSGAAVAAIVRRALQRAGIDAPSNGAHVLRHTLATRLLREGSSLPEIGEVLRHRQQQTTTIYAKVDFSSLRAIAPSWPGGVQ
ncbi:MAG: tyrosine-type recombinase/integrase [Piscinibacter sp.]|uniref:tyrosine-type recombinase/integrase n=1 Tax=Piscinibacter sp. TaxID=1903157 RepID=UPI00258A298A|nr:tyrosine-type recombinase/integrase [Piscinibacter sp.]MCW5663853.1 tyrosine-type recombinase/integrase [Piscinibacter sp.]